MSALPVMVWSDIACPWCWVGKRHLEAAIAELPFEVSVEWRAFELDPSAPRSLPDDVDYVERLAKKYRASRSQAQAMIDRMVGVGESVGLDFRFDRAKPGNTFDAHRLLHWAKGKGRQDALKERLFRAYMHEGRSVSDAETLVELAEAVGLDAEGAQAVLNTDAEAAEVRADEALAREIGITGVPFFVAGERYAVPGAQPAEVLQQVLERAWREVGGAEAAATSTTDEDGLACGPDGCAV